MDAQMTGYVLDYNFALPTVRVVADTESGFIIINQSEFDPKVHVEYSEQAAKPKKGAAKKTDDGTGTEQVADSASQ